MVRSHAMLLLSAWVLVVAACGEDPAGGGAPDTASADAATPDLFATGDAPAADDAGDAGAGDGEPSSEVDAGPPPTPLSAAECLADPTCDAVFTSAHRAKCGGEPENTVAGMRACIAAGVPMLELDTRETADGHIVLMHDATTERTTDGEARFPGRFAVDQLTRDEFKTLVVNDERCAAAPDEAPERCHPATWQEALAAVAGSNAVIFIDLKSSDATQTIAEAVAAGVADQVVLFDGSMANLAAGRAAYAPLVVMPRVASVAELDTLLANPAAQALDLRWVHVDSGYLAPAFAQAASAGVRLYLDVFGEVDAYFAAASLTADPTEAQAAREMGLEALGQIVADGGRGLGCEFCEQYLEALQPRGFGVN